VYLTEVHWRVKYCYGTGAICSENVSRLPVRNPSRASVTLRLTWLIQAASGSAVMPAISTRRVDNSMKKSTANRVRPRPVQTSTVKKSAAARTSQWVFRNSVHVVLFARLGAGSRPIHGGRWRWCYGRLHD
jgi:hypothetical protein